MYVYIFIHKIYTYMCIINVQHTPLHTLTHTHTHATNSMRINEDASCPIFLPLLSRSLDSPLPALSCFHYYCLLLISVWIYIVFICLT